MVLKIMSAVVIGFTALTLNLDAASRRKTRRKSAAQVEAPAQTGAEASASSSAPQEASTEEVEITEVSAASTTAAAPTDVATQDAAIQTRAENVARPAGLCRRIVRSACVSTAVAAGAAATAIPVLIYATPETYRTPAFWVIVTGTAAVLGYLSRVAYRNS